MQRTKSADLLIFQPPSGGCELKQVICVNCMSAKFQPPSGGCELKRCNVWSSRG